MTCFFRIMTFISQLRIMLIYIKSFKILNVFRANGLGSFYSPGHKNEIYFKDTGCVNNDLFNIMGVTDLSRGN